MSTGQRRLTELSSEESLHLLEGASLGRIVFTHRALPAIRLVRHLVDEGDIVIRGVGGVPIVGASDSPRGVVVAYQADAIDLGGDHGWSVTVTGTARLAGNPDQIARYRRGLRPWVEGELDQFICIHPEIITGFRLDGEHGAAAPGPIG